MRIVPRWIALLTIPAVIASPPKVVTADASYDVAIGDLKLTSGQLTRSEDHAGVRPFTLLRVVMQPQEAPPLLGPFKSANFGLTFDEQGLRAKLGPGRKQDE
jgi:hypothetical protein